MVHVGLSAIQSVLNLKLEILINAKINVSVESRTASYVVVLDVLPILTQSSIAYYTARTFSLKEFQDGKMLCKMLMY